MGTKANDQATGHQISRQRHAATVLGKLLERAYAKGLPVISWTIGTAGAAVVGRCDRPTSMAERRADYDTWRAALCQWAGTKPETDRENPVGSGDFHLVALWSWVAETRVVLTADIYTEDES